jgi:hypothetical protein
MIQALPPEPADGTEDQSIGPSYSIEFEDLIMYPASWTCRMARTVDPCQSTCESFGIED